MERHHKVLGQAWVIVFMFLAAAGIKNMFFTRGSLGLSRIPFSAMTKITDCWPTFDTQSVIRFHLYSSFNENYLSFDTFYYVVAFNIAFYVLAVLITLYYITNMKYASALFKALLFFIGFALLLGMVKLLKLKMISPNEDDMTGELAYYTHDAVIFRTFLIVVFLLIATMGSLWILFRKNKEDKSVDFSHLQPQTQRN